MCGIVAVVGATSAEPILLEAIKRLEYRGYDSSGLAILQKDGRPEVRKALGKVKDLESCLAENPIGKGTIGIVHTRWATHGDPTVENAHPHLSSDGKVAVVHNGTLDNFVHLRGELEKDGYIFSSQTDTEVLPNLIARELARGANTLEDAVAHALSYVDGAYGIAVMCRDTREVVAACNSSPLYVGLNGAAVFVASDPTALAGHASHFIPMEDGDIVTLSGAGHKFRHRNDGKVQKPTEVLDINPDDLGKGGEAHYMLKEILEQPRSTRATLSGRLKNGTVRLGGIDEAVEHRVAFARRITLVACGTSLYASQAGALFIEALARIPAQAAHASEYIYGDPIIDPTDVVIGVSQSGATADTLGAVRLAKRAKALCLGINNRVGSTLAREVEKGHGIYLHAGPEIAVASTKAFTSQVTVLALLAVRLAQLRKAGDPERISRIVHGLSELPALIERSLKTREQMFEIAQAYANAKRIFCLGRGFAVPLAYEGALKIKEIAYMDAEGYPGGELKHGPLALVEEGVPVVCILTKDEHGKKMLSNMEEVAARKGHVIALVSGDMEVRNGLAKHIVRLPEVPSELIAIIGAPSLQLLAYQLGVLRGSDVDQPRNLAKSVTVE